MTGGTVLLWLWKPPHVSRVQNELHNALRPMTRTRAEVVAIALRSRWTLHWTHKFHVWKREFARISQGRTFMAILHGIHGHQTCDEIRWLTSCHFKKWLVGFETIHVWHRATSRWNFMCFSCFSDSWNSLRQHTHVCKHCLMNHLEVPDWQVFSKCQSSSPLWNALGDRGEMNTSEYIWVSSVASLESKTSNLRTPRGLLRKIAEAIWRSSASSRRAGRMIER